MELVLNSVKLTTRSYGFTKSGNGLEFPRPFRGVHTDSGFSSAVASLRPLYACYSPSYTISPRTGYGFLHSATGVVLSLMAMPSLSHTAQHSFSLSLSLLNTPHRSETRDAPIHALLVASIELNVELSRRGARALAGSSTPDVGSVRNDASEDEKRSSNAAADSRREEVEGKALVSLFAFL